MPSAVACPKCKTKYTLPNHLLGKPVKCKSCGAMFQVNAPKPAMATASPSPQKKLSVATPGNAAELAKFGLDGPIQRQPELFGEVPSPRAGNPLGNHVVDDPGFAQVNALDPEEDDSDDISSMFHNPALGAPPTKNKGASELSGKRKGKKGKKNRKDPGEQVWLIVLGVSLVALIATVVMGLMMDVATATKAYFFGVNSIMALVSAGVSIWWLVRCFQCKDSVGQFLMVLFIPFYIFFFSFKPEKIANTRSPMNAWFVLAAGGVLLAAAAYFLGFYTEFNRLSGQA